MAPKSSAVMLFNSIIVTLGVAVYVLKLCDFVLSKVGGYSGGSGQRRKHVLVCMYVTQQ